MANAAEAVVATPPRRLPDNLHGLEPDALLAASGANATRPDAPTGVAAAGRGSPGLRLAAVRARPRAQAVAPVAALEPAPGEPAPAGQRAAPSDPYGFLELEPDFAWHAADGRRVLVAAVSDKDPPHWLGRSARERQRMRLVNAASWLVTGVVLLCVVGVAGLVMLGNEHFGPALRELTGFDVERSSVIPAAIAPVAAVPTGAPAERPAATAVDTRSGPGEAVSGAGRRR